MQHWVSIPGQQGLCASVPDSLSAHMHWKLSVCSATERQFDNKDFALLRGRGVGQRSESAAGLLTRLREGWMDGGWTGNAFRWLQFTI
jgi:hypothetical protein